MITKDEIEYTQHESGGDKPILYIFAQLKFPMMRIVAHHERERIEMVKHDLRMDVHRKLYGRIEDKVTRLQLAIGTENKKDVALLMKELKEMVSYKALE